MTPPDPDILLVDDNGAEVAIALRAFQQVTAAERIRVVRDGQEALDLLHLGNGADDATDVAEAPRPCVIFLDLKMPRVDGWEVLREIRSAEHTREIPVVVLSASDRDEDVQRCYQLGANSFLVKRFDGIRPGAYLADAARYWLELNQGFGPRRTVWVR